MLTVEIEAQLGTFETLAVPHSALFQAADVSPDFCMLDNFSRNDQGLCLTKGVGDKSPLQEVDEWHVTDQGLCLTKGVEGVKSPLQVVDERHAAVGEHGTVSIPGAHVRLWTQTIPLLLHDDAVPPGSPFIVKGEAMPGCGL